MHLTFPLRTVPSAGIHAPKNMAGKPQKSTQPLKFSSAYWERDFFESDMQRHSHKRYQQTLTIPAAEQRQASQDLFQLLQLEPDKAEALADAIRQKKPFDKPFLAPYQQGSIPVKIQFDPQYDNLFIGVNTALHDLEHIAFNLRIQLDQEGRVLSTSLAAEDAAFFSLLLEALEKPENTQSARFQRFTHPFKSKQNYWVSLLQHLSKSGPANGKPSLEPHRKVLRLLSLENHPSIKIHPGGSRKNKLDFLTQLNELPATIREVLLDEYQLILAGLLSDEFPEWKDQPIKGHRREQFIDEVPGFHFRISPVPVESPHSDELTHLHNNRSHTTPNFIAIPEKIRCRNPNGKDYSIYHLSYLAAFLRHEIGHALNFILGEANGLVTISAGKALQSALQEDSKHWSEEQREALQVESIEELCADINECLLWLLSEDKSRISKPLPEALAVKSACPRMTEILVQEITQRFRLKTDPRIGTNLPKANV